MPTLSETSRALRAANAVYTAFDFSASYFTTAIFSLTFGFTVFGATGSILAATEIESYAAAPGTSF